MYCPECGNQNPDSAKFCIGCGLQYSQQSAAPTSPAPQPVTIAATKSSSKTPWLIVGGLVILILGGVTFVLLQKGSNADAEISPAPRPRNSSNAATPAPVAAAPPTNVANTAPANSNTNVAVPTPSVVASTPKSAPPQPAKPAKKPVNCDKQCYGVYDRCMAEYRQFEDVENICRGKQSSCLGKCQ